MEENIIGYICEELGRANRNNARMEKLLDKQRNLNLLVGVIIFALVMKVSSMNKRVKALGPEGESD